MKNTIIILAVLTIFLSFTGCESMISIKGNGVIVEDERIIDDFSRLAIEGAFDVIIKYDTVTTLSIKTDENLLDYIQTYTLGDKLVLDVARNQTLRTNFIIVTITTPYIDDISLVGAGDIICGTFETEEFKVSISGSGDIDLDVFTNYLEIDISGSGNARLNGECGIADLNISGSGDINGREMNMDTCYVTVAGSGDMDLVINDLLDVYIAGSGDVYYRGNPLVKSQIVGSGVIKKRY